MFRSHPKSRLTVAVLIALAAPACSSVEPTTTTAVTTTTSTTDVTTTTTTDPGPTTSTDPAPIAIQLIPGGKLAGVAIGADTDTVLEAVTGVFGSPTDDTGWVVGCPLDGEDVINERLVKWGSLRVWFYGAPESGTLRAFGYYLDATTELPLLGGPGLDYVETPPGVILGQAIADTGAAVGLAPVFSEMFGSTTVDLDGVIFRAMGEGGDQTTVSGDVPWTPICE